MAQKWPKSGTSPLPIFGDFFLGVPDIEMNRNNQKYRGCVLVSIFRYLGPDLTVLLYLYRKIKFLKFNKKYWKNDQNFIKINQNFPQK